MGKQITNKSFQNGFTIVELLIVIVVIGILAAIALSSFTTAQARARDAKRETDIRALKTGVENYKAENGNYPSVCASGDNQGCAVTDLTAALQPYLTLIPTDPSNRASSYNYVRGAVGNESYAFRVRYETQPDCKTGKNVDSGWWGVAIPQC